MFLRDAYSSDDVQTFFKLEKNTNILEYPRDLAKDFYKIWNSYSTCSWIVFTWKNKFIKRLLS